MRVMVVVRARHPARTLGRSEDDEDDEEWDDLGRNDEIGGKENEVEDDETGGFFFST